MRLVALAILPLIAACQNGGATQADPVAAASTQASPRAAAAAAASEPATAGEPFRSEEFARFDEPWAMSFLPDGKLLVTENAGKLKLFDPATKTTGEITGLVSGMHSGAHEAEQSFAQVTAAIGARRPGSCPIRTCSTPLVFFAPCRSSRPGGTCWR